MNPALLESLEWRNIGPHRGGRVVAVTGHPTDKATFYFGACAGGVFKTTSGGAYWENVSDGFFRTAAIGAIALSQSDPNVIYAGTGETSIRGNVSHGDGIYKSTDAGRTWRNVGLEQTRHIGDIVIHPTDPDTVWVAALGRAFGTNEERGVFKTTDGGNSWNKVLYVGDRAGCTDIAMEPGNPRILYANIWQARRYPYKLESGGPDSGIWRSFDGGESWEEISDHPGLPEGVLGKIGLAASPARPGRVWALIEAEDGALFRSDDFGDTWTRLSEDPDLRRRAFYYMHVYADPQDAETVWVLNMMLKKSIDGGATFHPVPIPHGDNHDLWIDPEDTNRMIEGNDGGACVTYNGAKSWSTLLNQPTAQFYHVTTDNQVPYRLYGSQQDNWAISVPSIGFDGAITWRDWTGPGGGESGYIAVQPDPPHIIFGGAVGNGPGPGKLIAYDARTGHHREVAIWPEDHGFGEGAWKHKYRFQWTFPIEFSPHDSNTLYACSNHVHRSTDLGMSWEVISPDLSQADESMLQSSGGPITQDNSGVEIYGTIFAFQESPHRPGLFWAGTDDGLIHISYDSGQTWENITPPESLLPGWSLISIIDLSAHSESTAYVAATRYKHDDTTPYLLKTDDFGTSWKLITDGLPEDDFTRVVREDPGCQGLLYAGTETGLYISFDDGDSWQSFQGNLPVAPVHDLVIKNTDLVVASHGRSFWILDDITPLHQLMSDDQETEAKLFQPRPTFRFRYNQFIDSRVDDYTGYRMAGPVTVAYNIEKSPSGAVTQSFLDAGKNPPDGVIVHFYLADETEDEVRLTFLRQDGTRIRTFSSTSETSSNKLEIRSGANRFIWDMREQPETPEDEASEPDMFAAFMQTNLGPKVVPGSYQVQLAVGEWVFTHTFEILADPRVAATLADLQAQYDLLLRIRDKVSEINVTLNDLRRRRKQVNDIVGLVELSEGDPQMIELARSIVEKYDDVEGDFLNLQGASPLGFPNQLREKLVSLVRFVDSADAAPTQQSMEVFDVLADQVDERISWIDETIAPEIEMLSQSVKDIQLDPIV